MTATRSIVLAVMVLVGGVTLAAPAAGATVVGDLLQEDDGESETSPMGSQVSAFMQSSASVTDDSVENEMFVAAFENADDENQTQLVEQRANGLVEKLDRLEAERESLRNESGGMSEAQYNARIARLTSQIESLEKAINATEPRASEVGVDTTALEEVRANASELAGPEVAETARKIAGVDSPRGPPDHAKSNSDRGNGDGKEGKDRGTGNGSNPSENAPGQNDNSTDRGTGNESNPSERGPDGEGPPGKTGNASQGNAPGQSGDPPGQDDNPGRGDNPGQGGDPPGQSDTPGQDDNPGQSGNAPGQDDNPGQGNNAGQGGNAPGEGDNPGQGGDTPGQDDDSGQDDNPGQGGDPPGQSDDPGQNDDSEPESGSGPGGDAESGMDDDQGTSGGSGNQGGGPGSGAGGNGPGNA